MENSEKTNEKCYLCENESHIEDVTGEYGEYIDVLCFGSCPQYQISRSAINKLFNSPSTRKVVLQSITKRSHQSSKSVISFDVIDGHFLYRTA